MSMMQIKMFGADPPEPAYEAPPTEKVIAGSPSFTTWNYRESPDGRFFSGMWEATPGKWRIDYTEEEYCIIIAGRSVIADEAGTEFGVDPGDAFVIPAGFTGTWEVVETTRKHYAIYLPPSS